MAVNLVRGFGPSELSICDSALRSNTAREVIAVLATLMSWFDPIRELGSSEIRAEVEREAFLD